MVKAPTIPNKRNNYLGEIFPCRVQQLFSNNMYVKHILGILSLMFFVVLTRPNLYTSTNFIYVSAVNSATVNYLQNDGTSVGVDGDGNSYSGSLPIAESGSFYNATGVNAVAGANYFSSISNTNSQGLTSGNYTDAISNLEEALKLKKDPIIEKRIQEIKQEAKKEAEVATAAEAKAKEEAEAIKAQLEEAGAEVELK